MKSILAVAALVAALSLCNLSDKIKPEPTPTPKTAASASDREAVLAELMKIETELTTASLEETFPPSLRTSPTTLSGTTFDGKVQNKNQVLADTKPQRAVKSWKITEAQLISFDGDSAVLSYLQTLTGRNGRIVHARITDTFVKEMAVGWLSLEQQTLMK